MSGGGDKTDQQSKAAALKKAKDEFLEVGRISSDEAEGEEYFIGRTAQLSVRASLRVHTWRAACC